MRRHARTAILAYLVLASFLPFAMLNGIRKWDVVLGVFGAAIALATAAFAIMRRPERTFGEMLGYALGNAVLMVMLTRMVGPFTFAPALTCVVVMSVMAYPAFTVRSWVLILIMVTGFAAPIVLEHFGYLSRTWELREGMLISHAGALTVSTHSTLTLLLAGSVGTIAVAGLHAARIYRAGRDARIQLVAQAWHLRQLLPTATAVPGR